MVKNWIQFIVERFSLDDFGISSQDLDEILLYITDEFPELEYFVEDSLQSAIVERDPNCFIVVFNHKGIDFPSDLTVLHYVEPKIFSLIEDINSHLAEFGLYIYASDFGQSDAYYELVISKIGHKPKYTTKRW